MRNTSKFLNPVILYAIMIIMFSCKNPGQTVNVRLKLSSDLVSKDSITHIDYLLLTTDLGSLNGNRFSAFFKKPEIINFSNLKFVEPGVFLLDSIPRSKFYLVLITRINGIDFNIASEPELDLTKANKPVVEFGFKLDKAYVRRYRYKEK